MTQKSSIQQLQSTGSKLDATLTEPTLTRLLPPHSHTSRRALRRGHRFYLPHPHPFATEQLLFTYIQTTSTTQVFTVAQLSPTHSHPPSSHPAIQPSIHHTSPNPACCCPSLSLPQKLQHVIMPSPSKRPQRARRDSMRDDLASDLPDHSSPSRPAKRRKKVCSFLISVQCIIAPSRLV